MIDDEYGSPATWTASDFAPALNAAFRRHDEDLLCRFWAHGLCAIHCGGYEIHAWPCNEAAAMLEILLPDHPVMRRKELDRAWMEGYREGYASPDMPIDYVQLSPYHPDSDGAG